MRFPNSAGLMKSIHRERSPPINRQRSRRAISQRNTYGGKPKAKIALRLWGLAIELLLLRKAIGA